MIPLAFAIALAAASVMVLVVAVVSLAKQAMRLTGSLQELERSTRPILEEIQGHADRASARLERLQRAGTGPGDPSETEVDADRAWTGPGAVRDG